MTGRRLYRITDYMRKQIVERVKQGVPHGEIAQMFGISKDLVGRTARATIKADKAHGMTGYTKGCRCDVCRKSRADYMREKRLQGLYQ